jgi:chromosome segregation ATPase
MPRIPKFLPVIGVLSALAAGALGADNADSGEARLRQTLRDTMVQLRQSQTDLSSLQAAQAAQADEEKTLKDQLALMSKHSVEDRAESGNAIEALKAKLAGQTGQIARLEEALAQWKAAAEKMNQVARAVDAQRAKASARAAFLERRAEDLKGKNEELFRLGNEILTRYEKFSLGEQFLAREPFIGRARVELENQIQDYGDQLQAQKATP